MVFVTGGSGFIGKYVVRRLEGKKALVLVRDKANYQQQGDETVLEGSLQNMADWKSKMGEYPVDACIHLAWEGIPDYSYEMSERNLEYGLDILRLCREFQIRKLVIAGSCWEYGNPHGAVSVEAPIGYETPFQAAKNSLRMMAHAFCRENGIQLHWLRLFYVYGPGQREGSLIPYMLRCFRAGKQPELKGAYNQNDFVYVGDVAEAIVMAVKQKNMPELLNIGSGKSVQVLALAEMVATALDFGFHAEAYQQTSDAVNYWADMTGGVWRAKYNLRDGVQDMINHV